MLAPIFGTTRVLAATRAECFEVDVALDDVELAFPLGSEPMGGGGWDDDYLFFFEADGTLHERRCRARARPRSLTARTGKYPIRACAVARKARRVVLSVPWDWPQTGWVSSDSLEVRDMASTPSGSTVFRFDPPTHDVFNIGAVAISDDGEWVGLTGDAVVFGSDGPATWVHEKAAFVGVGATRKSENIIIDIGEARFGHDVTRAIALGATDKDWAYLDRHRLSLAKNEVRATTAGSPVDMEDFESRDIRVGTHLNALLDLGDGGAFAAIGQQSLVVGHWKEPNESDSVVETDAPITAATSIEGAIVIGHGDGRVVRITRS